ncbi:hypothetical protein PUN28_013696 [Cardiocondyla obscurior]|uniref:Uncharacterized protein n=1 Tax=Cardiocondyla obscurior TaxID=286306 RepID=A0AAW2F6V2_9HYME
MAGPFEKLTATADSPFCECRGFFNIERWHSTRRNSVFLTRTFRKMKLSRIRKERNANRRKTREALSRSLRITKRRNIGNGDGLFPLKFPSWCLNDVGRRIRYLGRSLGFPSVPLT